MRVILNAYPIWSGVGGFLWKLISLFSISWMCLIWLNVHLFSWILVLKIILSLRDVMTCTLLHFPVIFWLEMYYKTCWTVVGSFLTIMRIQTLILFLSGDRLFHGLLFVDWYIYYMLWCSHHCDTIPMGVPIGVKLTLTSNISYFMKVWYERSIFNVGRVEVFVSSISS